MTQLSEPGADSTGEEMFARGRNAGWDASNFAVAYGGDTFDLESLQQEHGTDYVNGFAEGVYRYLNGQWQDGTPREA
ncbi:hypothetical protein ACGFIF_42865 [Kribbella sp. NPDC049174]|uniref:hypothetical protein n=1 Tax=Kribbella sp. NPDC049174 TaxID=3364112 RepID=UPI003712783F